MAYTKIEIKTSVKQWASCISNVDGKSKQFVFILDSFVDDDKIINFIEANTIYLVKEVHRTTTRFSLIQNDLDERDISIFGRYLLNGQMVSADKLYMAGVKKSVSIEELELQLKNIYGSEFQIRRHLVKYR